MRFSTVAGAFLAVAAPALVAAQTQVFVGMNGTLTFNPPELNVPIGGTVEFIFMSKNHSVYQSSFADPCTPLANGFEAPFFPIASDQTDNFPTITLQVTQTAPLWFYCPQTNPANHCKAGMVGTINPTADKTLAAFKAAAMGQPAGATGANTTTGATGGATTGTADSGAAPGAAAAGAVAGVAGNGTAAGAAGNGTATGAGDKSGAIPTSASSGLVVALALLAGSTVFAL